MCGRYYLHITMERLLERYGIKEAGIDLTPRGEICPSESAPVIISGRSGERDSGDKPPRDLQSFKWGFSPFYRKGLIINARAETIEKKPLFREAFQQRRCLIPASGFFEWQGERGRKTKYRFFLEDQPVFSLAGLYSPFQNEIGESVNCFTIITTAASSKIRAIHDRMPVILEKDLEDLWLDQENNNQASLNGYLQPYSAKNLSMMADTGGENPTQLGFDFD